MAYENCSAHLIINKRLSENIPVLSSVRQGCPLSPLLFAIFLEPFCLKVRENENIRGYRLLTQEVKILAYADDIALFCIDQESIREAVKDARKFCSLTGSAISWPKSLGFWHGEWDSRPAVLETVPFTDTPTSYLGVPLEYYRDTTTQWTEQTERAKAQTTKWGGKNLSIFTRATVCNLFLVAKVFYMLQVLCISRVCVQKLHRVFAMFVWGSGWERTSRLNLFHAVQKGGLGLSHLFLKQVVSRFMFLRDESDCFLRCVIQTRLGDALPEYVVTSYGIRQVVVRGFLFEVISSFRFLKVHFSLEYLNTVARKRLYRDLVNIMCPVPIYRAVYALGREQNVLKRVKKMPVRATTKTFFFMLHTGTLPVKPWLQEKGIFVPWSVNCQICQKPETMEHIFLECRDSVFLWDILQRTLKKEFPLTPFGIRFLPFEETEGVPCDMVMLLCMHSVWKTRMAVRNEDVDAKPAKEYFAENVLYIREAFKALSEPPEWLTAFEQLANIQPF